MLHANSRHSGFHQKTKVFRWFKAAARFRAAAFSGCGGKTSLRLPDAFACATRRAFQGQLFMACQPSGS